MRAVDVVVDAVGAGVRRAARIDSNQGEIVQALRKVGASVQSLAACGQGVPDLLVGFRGQTWLMEVKDGKRPPSERELTPDQQQWQKLWRGMPVWVVMSEQDALIALSVLTI